MIFAPLFSVFEWLHATSSRSPQFFAVSKTDVTTSPAIALKDLDQETTVGSDQGLPTVHASTISNGLSDSDHERLDGVVTIDIHPNRLGQIKFAGGWWSAKCGRAIILKAGTLVKVIGRENIILIVEPMGAHPHLMEQWAEII